LNEWDVTLPPQQLARSEPRQLSAFAGEVGLVGIASELRERRQGGIGIAATEPDETLESHDPDEPLRSVPDRHQRSAVELAPAEAEPLRQAVNLWPGVKGGPHQCGNGRVAPIRLGDPDGDTQFEQPSRVARRRRLVESAGDVVRFAAPDCAEIDSQSGELARCHAEERWGPTWSQTDPDHRRPRLPLERHRCFVGAGDEQTRAVPDNVDTPIGQDAIDRRRPLRADTADPTADQILGYARRRSNFSIRRFTGSAECHRGECST
jgi:hypothetical protein